MWGWGALGGMQDPGFSAGSEGQLRGTLAHTGRGPGSPGAGQPQKAQGSSGSHWAEASTCPQGKDGEVITGCPEGDGTKPRQGRAGAGPPGGGGRLPSYLVGPHPVGSGRG